MTTYMIREVSIQYGRNASAPNAILTPDDVATFFRATIGNDAREHMLAIYLNGRHRPIAWQVVSVGTANASLVHPREIFQPACQVGAVALILAHNHPSGEVSPSGEDETLTGRIAKAGAIIGIRLLDHVIVTDSDFYSFSANLTELFNHKEV